jgi:hypothetical protein
MSQACVALATAHVRKIRPALDGVQQLNPFRVQRNRALGGCTAVHATQDRSTARTARRAAQTTFVVARRARSTSALVHGPSRLS